MARAAIRALLRGTACKDGPNKFFGLDAKHGEGVGSSVSGGVVDSRMKEAEGVSIGSETMVDSARESDISESGDLEAIRS